MYQPAAAKARHTARPMPPDAPVTRTEERVNPVALDFPFIETVRLGEGIARGIMKAASPQRKPGRIDPRLSLLHL